MAAALWPAVPSGQAGDYSSAVLKDGPAAYYRFNDSQLKQNINANSGSLGAAGNATNINVHRIPGAIVGSKNAATYFDSTARTIVPWNAALNPDGSTSFTIEAWFYPTSDKVAGSFVGPAPIMNRYSYSGVNRQGWVYFQRNPDDTYASDGQTDVGWNFRTYRASSSSTGISMTSQKPYRLGQWQHVVTVWDGPAKTATMYIDGQEAATQTWTGDGPGYVANTDDHPATEAVNGPAGLCVGSYNNTETGSNPFRGGVDEMALYAKKLTATQILAHYQNATNAARSVSYDTLILADGPVGYWRMDDAPATPEVAVNMGLLQNSGHGEISTEVRHPVPGPLAGADDSAYSFHWRNGSATVDIPFAADNNPEATVPFTFEAWFRPTSDRQSPGACPVNNRLSSGAANRTGWVIFQRAPNDTYSGVSGFEGVGWDFRMYKGEGSGSTDLVSDVPYTVGQWQHLVVTFDGASTGIMYIDGKSVLTNEAMIYTANSNPPLPPDDALTAADLAVGAYNKASGLGGNPFEGDVDELAIYKNAVLTSEQILAHYQAGTNSHRAENYQTSILSAAYDGAGTQALQPATYLRFSEFAAAPAANSGTAGDSAPANPVLADNQAAGPAGPGFETANKAVALDGSKAWISLGSPAALNLSGQISLEAWIKPSATQGTTARILSHGPLTLSSYNDTQVATNGSVVASPEVFLRLEENGAKYAVGVSDGTNTTGATFPVPTGDLGGDSWIHLAGTYDGANWKLFRNGQEVASSAGQPGALKVDGGDWAAGAAGNGWADLFAGAIDEAAIYSYALKPAQVQAHYAAATSAQPPTIAISLAGSDVTLTWPSGTLQQADTVNGQFAEVPGATSPYTIKASGAQKFYRCKK